MRSFWLSKFRGQYQRCSLLLGATLLASCSHLPFVTPAAQPVDPFTVQILEDAFDAQQLTVSGIVHAHVTESVERIALRISVSDRGQVIASRLVLPCVDAFPPVPGVECQLGVLASGRQLPFRVTLPVPKGSDYQVELLWGDDAEAVRPQVVLADVVVHDLAAGCRVAPCQQGFVVQGILRNISRRVVSGVTLGVGYISAVHATGGQATPDSEESLHIPGALQPAEQRPFRIRLGSALSATESARVRPAVRIVGEG